MSVVTFEGVVEDGQVRLPPDVRLPNRALVYVVVPDASRVPSGAQPEVATPRHARIASPRLARPEQAKDFVMEVSEEPGDARL